METKNLKTTCPCGEILEIEYRHGEYDIMGLKCPECGNRVGSGNSRTGEITSWETRAQRDKVNAESIRDEQTAAPDLLAACKEFIRCLDIAVTVVSNKPTMNLHEMRQSDCILAIEAAIAKAEQ